MMDSLLSNYSSVDFIFDLEVDDFLEVLNKSLERDKQRIEAENLERDNKVDEILVHLWGYQLPFLEKKISYGAYRDRILNESKPKAKITKQDNQMLIEEMERLKSIDQNRA